MANSFVYTLQDSEFKGARIDRIAPNDDLLFKTLSRQYPGVVFDVLDKYELVQCEGCE